MNAFRDVLTADLIRLAHQHCTYRRLLREATPLARRTLCHPPRDDISKYCCENIPVIIRPEDLSGRIPDVDVKSAGLFPEWSARNFFDDIEACKARQKYEHFDLSPEDEKTLITKRSNLIVGIQQLVT